MVRTTLSNFRQHQSEFVDTVQREPIELLSRGARRRAVLVSPEFFDRAVAALEDQLDVRDAARARDEHGSVSHAELMAELGL